MGQIKMTQAFGVTPEELKEHIVTDVRAEFKTLAQHFLPTQPPDYLSPKNTKKSIGK